MKQAYPIVITPDDSFYVVYVPDFNVNTQGETIAEAMEMARDVIGMTGCYRQDEGQTMPRPSSLETVDAKTGEVVTLVDIDFDAYRRKHDMRTIRKNCTIPSWLNEEAEKAGINFSALLQSALKNELHIADQ